MLDAPHIAAKGSIILNSGNGINLSAGVFTKTLVESVIEITAIVLFYKAQNVSLQNSCL